MTQTKKRILFYLIPLFLLLIAIPMTANAAAQERREPLVVWEAAPADNEGWTWDVQRKTLKLNGFNLKVKNAESALGLPNDPCTVILEGVNKITVDGKRSSALIAIWGSDIKFTGNGSLEIAVKNSSGGATGIGAKNLNIDKCSIKINTSANKDTSFGVFAQESITLNGCKANVVATSNSRHTAGFMAMGSIIADNSNLTFDVKSKTSDAAAMIALNWDNRDAKTSILCSNTKISLISTAKYGAIGLSSKSVQITGGSVDAKCISSATTKRKIVAFGDPVGIMSEDDLKLINCQTNIDVKAKKEFASALWGKGVITIDGGKTALSGKTYAAISNTGIKLNKVSGTKGEVVAYGAQGDGGKLYCFAQKGSPEQIDWKDDALIGRCQKITLQ
jgi:hypothetical protein